MEYITSRDYELPIDAFEMENSLWFNMWRRKNFPYKELRDGDILYWYESPAQKLVWKTQVIEVKSHPYSDKEEVFKKHPNSFSEKFHESRPDSGYYIGYKVKVIEKIDIGKPTGFRFPQLGWLKVNNEVISNWVNSRLITDAHAPNNVVSSDRTHLIELLGDLNEEMKNVSPEKVKKIVSSIIRNDTAIIQMLKKVNSFKCQFPDCGQQILKKNGDFYIEVAHIEPVAQGGKSILGNLIVLCPNHHKEFDYGDLKINDQTKSHIAGLLNGKEFQISL